MTEASESPPRASEGGTAAGADAQSSEHPLDFDVSSSTGPYPRPRTPRRALRTIWLAAAGAAIILGLTWARFRHGEEPPSPPPPPPLPQAASTSPVMAASAAPLTGPTEEVLDFSPVLDQPSDRPEPSAETSQAADEVEDQPDETSQAADEAASQPDETDQAADEAVDQPADQPAETPPADQTVAETVEISDKWVVNISSTPDSAESQRFLSALSGQDLGGRVYASQAVVEGRLQHRIRVGFFDTREEAEAVGLKIKEHFNLNATPWAVRPYKSEEENQGGR